MEFKAALRTYQEKQKCQNGEKGDNVMIIRGNEKSREKFEGNCLKCDEKQDT